MKDVIFEGSKPGYFKYTLIQAGMERGSAVCTAGVKLEVASDDDEYIGDESHKIYRSVCGRLHSKIEKERHALSKSGSAWR
eukprot:3437877-Amphidinium_carterae.1